jgi:predicted nucleotidyltransferase
MAADARPDPTELAALANRHHVRLLLQHGSTVRGTTHAKSDLDLAVLMDGSRVSTDEYLNLASQLQQLFPGQEVDLVLLNHADPLLLKRVTDAAALLYGDPAHLRDLKLYAFKRYQDHRRFLAMERDYVRRKVAAAGR